MALDRAAATGAPTANAMPATAASTREPVAAGASPAPSNAKAGIAAMVIVKGMIRGRPSVSGATIAATVVTPPRRIAARSAPRRAVRIAARRRPVGSGRQFGDHGLPGPMAPNVPSEAPDETAFGAS